jgi:hypothetical protein
MERSLKLIISWGTKQPQQILKNSNNPMQSL